VGRGSGAVPRKKLELFTFKCVFKLVASPICLWCVRAPLL
jgi:hypothetical protein